MTDLHNQIDAKAYRAFHEELSRHIEHGDQAYAAAITAYLSTLHGQQSEAVASVSEPANAPALESKPVEWLWWGQDARGKDHVSFGRWQKHPCQYRYKYASPQATEHDHPVTTAPTEAAPVAVKDALNCVVHALMVLPVPIDGQGKRAWASLLEAQKLLDAAIIPAAKPAGVEEALLRKARNFIEEEWERTPDRHHPNDRDGIEDRNALRPELIAELNSALSGIATDGEAGS